MFAILVNKSKYADTSYCFTRCNPTSENNWAKIHLEESYEQFWGASLVCFILGAYQLAVAAYTYGTLEEDARDVNAAKTHTQ